MKKNIKLEINFPDNFVPPEKFDDPEQNDDYDSKCDLCPFFVWEAEYGFACCLALGDDPKTDVCPIKAQY